MIEDPRAPYGNHLQMPHISDALLDALKQRFDVPIPELRHTEREIWVARGAWSVIQFLQHTYDEQNSNVHE